MGSCLHSRAGVDVDSIEYEQTNINTPTNDNNIHKIDTHIHAIPALNINANHIHNIKSVCSNSSGSSSSILPDEIIPNLQTIPSQSHTITNTQPYHPMHRTPTVNKTPNSTDKNNKSLEIISDIDEFPDNPEIDDKHQYHMTHDSHSDETYNNNVRNNHNNITSKNNMTQRNNNIENQNEINGKAEYESDDTKENESESIDTDEDSDDQDDEDDEDDEDEDEDEPLPKDDNYKIVMNDQENDMDNITFKCIQSASATQAGTSKGKSKTNQDSFILIDSFGPNSLFQLYGVCDGHGPNGNHVSKYVTDNLPNIINKLLCDNNTLSIKSILKQSFTLIESQLTDLQSSNELSFDINYSGTTATIGLFAGNKLYVANIGDSRTVLGKVGQHHKTVPIAVALSNDHDPNNITEMLRIKKTKSAKILFDDDNDARIQIEIPEIIQNENLLCIDKILAVENKNKNKTTKSKHRRTQSQVKKISASVSRSIGDKMAHTYGGLISEPEITVHNLSELDIFVIFASDGIWQMIENDDVMRTVGTKLNQNKSVKMYSDLQKTTSKLVREANISWQDEYEDYTDDITCVIVRIGKI